MKLDELRTLPAWTGLTDTEKAQVEARVRDWHLDAPLVSAGGDPDTLETDDLRHWLKSTHPWEAIALTPPSPLADTTFAALRTAAPNEDPGVLRSTARALADAATALARDGSLREELLGALAVRLEGLDLTPPAELAPLLAAIDTWRAAESGLQGFLSRVAEQVGTAAFDLTHGGLFVATGKPDHEGHYRDGEWRNWTANYRARPAHWAVPRSEDELCAIVASARTLRTVGAGHSFNDGPLCDDTMLSLDALGRVLNLDPVARTARVQAGIRLRDLNRLLWTAGLGLPMLGSTDAQSVGALVSTDLHGTGRDHGFLSEQVRSLRVVAADGTARTVRPGDPLYHATFGAIGTVGVVSEVELDLVDAFHLEKTTALVDRAASEADIETLIAGCDHLSFYYVAGGATCDTVRMNRWRHVPGPATPDWEKKKVAAELKDFALSAWLPGVTTALVGLDEDAPLSDALVPDETLTLPGSVGFGRKLFYRHDEIELAVPFERYRECLAEVMQLLAVERFFSVVEVRFTPDRARSWIGPGAGQRSAWIELATPLEQPREAIYARFEAILARYGGRPHLGKKTMATSQDLLKLHGERFVRQDEVRRAQDPDGRFLNPFTRRVLVP